MPDITVSDHGPLRVSAIGLALKDSTGKPYDLAGREMVSLCRCGASAKKPFCDGSHRAAGFQSKCEAFALPPPPPKLG